MSISQLPEKVFLPVNHVVSESQCERNLVVASTAGADGAFLISHGALNAEELSTIYHTMKTRIPPDMLLGINFLDQSGLAAFGYTRRHATDNTEERSVDALWIDNGINRYDPPRPALINEARQAARFNGVLFGGVAFKGHREVDDSLLPGMCHMAKACMEVVTTSGPQTGSPPNLRKIQTMRTALGKHPLAIASGIDETNVKMFLPYVNYFLVASSIGSSFTELDAEKTRRLADIIHDAS